MKENIVILSSGGAAAVVETDGETITIQKLKDFYNAFTCELLTKSGETVGDMLKQEVYKATEDFFEKLIENSK